MTVVSHKLYSDFKVHCSDFNDVPFNCMHKQSSARVLSTESRQKCWSNSADQAAFDGTTLYAYPTLIILIDGAWWAVVPVATLYL